MQVKRGNDRAKGRAARGMPAQGIEVVNIGGIRTIQIPEINIPDLPDAVCKGVDGELFFPGRSKEQAKQAKQMCFRCPVRLKCLNEALDWDRANSVADRTQGIWGGTNEGERIAIIERENRAVP